MYSGDQSKLNYDSIAMHFLQRGWKVQTQLPGTIVYKKVVGVNGWVATILMLLFALFGMVGVLIWIAAGGQATYTVQAGPGDPVAFISGKNMFNTPIRSASDLHMVLSAAEGTGWKLGYGAAVAIGIVCWIINVAILFAMR
jgi:hypothetical protein